MTQSRSGAAFELDPADFLADLNTDHVFFCPNPGNAGDSAISVGAWNVFRSLGIRCTTVDWDEPFDSAGKVVVYGGGGNLAAAYPQARMFIERHHMRAQKLVLLPHTIQGNRDMLSVLGPNVVLFCREMRSFEHAKSTVTAAQVYLADDLALKVDVNDLLDFRPSTSRVVERLSSRVIGAFAGRIRRFEAGGSGESLRSSVFEGSRALRLIMRPGNTHLYAIRRDREACGEAPPPANVDISAVFAFGVTPETTARESTIYMLAYLDRFDQITTNRLHVCILGAMLGKQIRFHANNYFKNEEVYRYSLANRFPDIHWSGEWTS